MESNLLLSNNWIFLFIVLLVFILVKFLILFLSRKSKYPYEQKSEYLTKAELVFLKVLRQAINGSYEIVTQVPLGSIVRVKSNSKNYYKYYNQIDRKILDFVLFDKSNFKPLLVIELDDSSHNLPDRKNRDKFVDKVLGVVKIPILHLPTRYSYNTSELIDNIKQNMQTYTR